MFIVRLNERSPKPRWSLQQPDKSSPDAIVINLATATARRALQEEQLSSLGLSYQFLDATCPQDIDRSELSDRKVRWGRPLKDSEVACLLSHRRVWVHVANRARPVLVLEDDAILARQTNELIQELFRLENVDLVNLEGHHKPKRLADKRYTVLVSGYTISRIFRERSGAAAYIIWPDAARKMLAFTETDSPLADAALALAPDMARYQLEPAAATQGTSLPAFSSIIGPSSVSSAHRTKFESIGTWLQGKLIRLNASWTISRNIASGLGRSTKRIVSFRA